MSGTDRGRAAATVIVCAYSLARWPLTQAAVASALRQRPAPAEVIVVIDHNPELESLARDELSGVAVMASTGQRGLSGARNTGLAAATQPISVFLDDDAEAQEGWLASLLEPYDDPLVVATGGGVFPEWPDSRPRWLAPEFDWVVGCSYVGLPETAGVVRNPIGANMSLQTERARQAGGFDGTIGRVGTRPRGCEETDLAIRLTTAVAGSKVMYVPTATVLHHVAAERTRVRYFLRRCWHEGQSKAAVARSVGASAALQRERRQIAMVIPAAFLRDLHSLVTGDSAGGLRVVASAAGLTATVSGYLGGRVRWRIRGS